MRIKETKAVVSFDSTHEAIRMEKVMKENKAPGRIIPVPSSITAGCGLAYCTDVDARENIISLMEKYSVKYSKVYIMDI